MQELHHEDFINLLNLNQSQQEALNMEQGPLLVLAGAGTGKTKLIVSKIAYLIYKGVHPSKILAVTFTNKAALSLKTRLEQLIGPQDYWPLMGTFHNISLRFLRKHNRMLELSNNFNIIDEADQRKILKNLVLENNLDLKETPGKLATYMARFKDDDTYAQRANSCLRTLYDLYNAKLTQLRVLDFGDLILRATDLFNLEPKIGNFFEYIFVDEYQDINHGQYQWLKALCNNNPNPNLCVVGDDDQSIYGWRGAKIEHILNFSQHFTKASVVKLQHNYRSVPNILEAANSIIKNNVNRYQKQLTSALDCVNNFKIKIAKLEMPRDEAIYVCKVINKLVYFEDYKFSQIAILVRASHQVTDLEEIFNQYLIPYNIYSGINFYDYAEIKDLICYLRLVQDKNDMLALERVLNVPRRGIGPKAMQMLNNLFLDNPDRALYMWVNNYLKGATKQNITIMLQMLDQLKNLNLNPVDALNHIISSINYFEFINYDENKMQHVEELKNNLQNFTTLSEFLDYASLLNTKDEHANADKVQIMTLHAAKGLEFNCVFLIGWEEGVFPSNLAIAYNNLEEERRLAYVGITRAKEKLFISFCKKRITYGSISFSSASRFLLEMDKHTYEI